MSSERGASSHEHLSPPMTSPHVAFEQVPPLGGPSRARDLVRSFSKATSSLFFGRNSSASSQRQIRRRSFSDIDFRHSLAHCPPLPPAPLPSSSTPSTSASSSASTAPTSPLISPQPPAYSQTQSQPPSSSIFAPLQQQQQQDIREEAGYANLEVEMWSIEDVCEWLKAEAKQPSALIDLFRTQQIDGVVLLSLSERDLEEEPFASVTKQLTFGEKRKLTLLLNQLAQNPHLHLNSHLKSRSLNEANYSRGAGVYGGGVAMGMSMGTSESASASSSSASVSAAAHLPSNAFLHSINGYGHSHPHQPHPFVYQPPSSPQLFHYNFGHHPHPHPHPHQHQHQQHQHQLAHPSNSHNNHYYNHNMLSSTPPVSAPPSQPASPRISSAVADDDECVECVEEMAISWSTGVSLLWDASLEQWSSTWSKLLFSSCYCASVFLLTALTMVLVHERVPDKASYPPLPDIVLDNVARIPWSFQLVELIILTQGLILLTIVLMHTHRFVILRRWNAIVGTCFLLRCVTMYITSLSVPGTHLDCRPLESNTVEDKLMRAWEIASGLGLSIQGIYTCGDYMFSGHTIILTNLNYFINEYSPASYKGLHIFSWICNVFGMFMILAGHEHYSIDVFIAFYISSRMFVRYHSMANTTFLYTAKKQYEDVDGWFPFLAYLEEYANGVLPNDYEWPWVGIKQAIQSRYNKLKRSRALRSFRLDSKTPVSLDFSKAASGVLNEDVTATPVKNRVAKYQEESKLPPHPQRAGENANMANAINKKASGSVAPTNSNSYGIPSTPPQTSMRRRGNMSKQA